MRDKKRKEKALLEEAYTSVYREDRETLNEAGPLAALALPAAAIAAPVAIPAAKKLAEISPMGQAAKGVLASDEESCGEYDQSEIDMAGRDLLKAQEYAAKLSAMVQQLPGLDGWVASKITKASDYLSSVYHFLDYEMHEKPQEVVVDVEEIEAPVEVFNVGYEETENT
jgi:hypothetical protein|tara:strand:- start:1542 stop:2048 length:507 start_codon:yes stop_codon:yes gene_type:complete